MCPIIYSSPRNERLNAFPLFPFVFLLEIFLLLISLSAFSASVSWDGGGDGVTWSSANNWNPDGVPASIDDVTIDGAAYTVTVDGAYTCNNLTIGNTGGFNITVQITNLSNSLTVNGALSINASNSVFTYILNAGPGTINIAGTFPTWGTAGTNSIRVSSGNITFSPSITIANTAQDITFTGGAGTITFNSSFTDTYNKFVTVAGCTVNFNSSYTVNTTAVAWNTSSAAVFNGTGTVTANFDLYFGDVTFNGTTTFAASSGWVRVQKSTLNSGATLTMNRSFELRGDWTNNSGPAAFSMGASNRIYFKGQGMNVGGLYSTTFTNVYTGSGPVNISCTINKNISCSYIEFTSDDKNATITLGSSSVTLTVSGAVKINQPSGDNITHLLNVNTGTCNIGGNINFSGLSSTASRLAMVKVTSGTLSVTGTVTWIAGQPFPQAVATEVISVTTGTISFGGSVSMPDGSGTLEVTGNGTINFNGATAPSFDFFNGANGADIDPVFTTSSGSTLNFANGFTNSNVAYIFADGSTAVFTGNGTVTPNAAITFGNLQINSGVTLSLAGNISLANNWTNNGGTFSPGTNTVTFSGSGTQTITKTGGETFYTLTTSTSGATVQPGSNVIVTNTLNMNGHNFNLNTYTLQLGSGSGATLTRTAGQIYGGTFSRYIPIGPMSSTVAPLYGLFPMGTAAEYRPIEINSTVDPTSAGYISASHTDAITVTDVSYTDNESAAIQRITDQKSTLSTSGGFAGGTYDLYVTMTSLSGTGNLSDLKMETIAGSPPGVGISAATAGSVGAPIVKRTGLTASELVNDFVVATINKTVTPIRTYYYSITNGSWATVGVWSYSSGGPSCGCTPDPGGYAIIESTVSVSSPANIDFIDIKTGGTLNGASDLTVNYDLTTYGSGIFSPSSGNWTLNRNVVLSGTGSSSTSSGTTSVAGDLTIGTGTALTLGNNLTASGNFTLNGSFNLNGNNFTLNGSNKNISGSASITTNAGAPTITITNNKTITAGSSMTIGSAALPITLALSTATTITNKGTITMNGNMTGTDATSVWTNAYNSTLTMGAATSALLATGTLNASDALNTVNYNGSGAQSIKTPSSSYYNLICSNAGTKTMGASFSCTNMVTISGSAVLDETTFALTGAAGLTMSGTSELKMSRTVQAVYPELTGPYSLTGGTVTLSQTVTNGYLRGSVTYYNLNLLGSSSKGMDLVHNITNDLTVSGSGRVQYLNSLTIGNNFTLSSTNTNNWMSGNITTGSFTQTAGTLNDGGYIVTVNGSGTVWSRTAGTYSLTTTGGVIFSGSSAQTIGGTISTTFNNLTINNSGGVTLAASASPTTVNGVLSLSNGLLTSSSSNTLTLGSAASVGAVSNSSFVNGPVSKVGSANFTFPVGKDAKYRPISVTSLSGSETFTAEYFHSDPDPFYSTSSKDPTLDHISITEYWILNRAGAQNAFVTLSWDSYSFFTVDNLSDLAVARWDGAVWRDHGNGGTTGSVSPGTGTIITSAIVTAFSPFTLASKTINNPNPFPIELLYFDVKWKDGNHNAALLDWATAAEINNDYFEIQRSVDAVNFAAILQVPGAGNSSSTIIYSQIDSDPITDKTSYYRLKQVDFNGDFSYSNIVALNAPEGIDIINIWPNPSVNNFTFLITSTNAENINIEVINTNGKKVISLNQPIGEGVSIISVDTKNLISGFYLLRVMTESGNYKDQIQLIINRTE